MASINLLPTGNGYTLQFIVFAGSRPTCVQTNDGDSTGVRCNRTDVKTDAYTVDDAPSDFATTTTLYSRFIMRKDGTGTNSNVRNGVRYSGTNAWGTLGSGYTSGYTDYLPKLHTTAPGGGSWDRDTINASEVLFYNNGDGSANSVRVTMAYLQLTYVVAAGGGFVFALRQYLMPLLGTGITFGQMGSLCSALREASGLRQLTYEPHEWPMLYAAWTAYTHPVQFDFAAR
jgi:hypothetical protein